MKILMEKTLSKARELNARYPLVDFTKLKHLNFEEFSAMKGKFCLQNVMRGAMPGGNDFVNNHAQYLRLSFYLMGELFSQASEKSGMRIGEAREFWSAMRAPLFQPLPFDADNLDCCLEGTPAFGKSGKFIEQFGESLLSFRLSLMKMSIPDYCNDLQPNHVRWHSANLLDKIYRKVAGTAEIHFLQQ